jgi:hypothetical protein
MLRPERRQGNMNLWKEREGGCGKRETGSGQRDVVWGRESMGEMVLAIGKGKQCQSIGGFLRGKEINRG